ncbi:hypothetical protein DRO97_08000 [Archaeoglobales archaeon]|nr:MAG: hypothetical protein DRO97_08000 [Archaeoglobales archaeon]
MVSENIIKLVNHEAWIECQQRGRAYLKWGHLPETDGKLDPKSIKRAFVIDAEGNEKAMVVGSDKEASSKGGLFLEFNAEKEGVYTIAVEYDRGIYSVTEDNKWIFGEKSYVASLGYTVKESRWICGFAKAYAIVGDYEDRVTAGLEFEIIGDIKKFKSGDKIKVQLFFRDNPVKGEVNARANGKHAVIETDSNGFAEIELVDGLNVISARYVDEMTKIAGVCDKRSITTTLAIVVD